MRAAFEEVLLGRKPTGGPVNAAIEVEGLLVALCDSSRPGRNDGLLEDETLDWLTARWPPTGRRWSASTTRRCRCTARCWTRSG